MDPVSEQVVSYTGGKVADVLLAQFKTQVIDRWSRQRARTFFGHDLLVVRDGLGHGSVAVTQAYHLHKTTHLGAGGRPRGY